MGILGGGPDAALTAVVSAASAVAFRVHRMTDDGVDAMIRRAIGGDAGAISSVMAEAGTIDDAVLLTMAALLERLPDRLDRAALFAVTSRDRQVVAIARAHLDDNRQLVDALARDHLVDHPDSLIVAWIASDAVIRARADRPVPNTPTSKGQNHE